MFPVHSAASTCWATEQNKPVDVQLISRKMMAKLKQTKKPCSMYINNIKPYLLIWGKVSVIRAWECSTKPCRNKPLYPSTYFAGLLWSYTLSHPSNEDQPGGRGCSGPYGWFCPLEGANHNPSCHGNERHERVYAPGFSELEPSGRLIPICED